MYSELNKLSEYIYTFAYQKTLLRALLLLNFKNGKSNQCILKGTLEHLKLSTSKHFDLLRVYSHKTGS